MASHQPLYRKVGRFEPTVLLGRGGFGDVFLARDPERDQPVALKALPLAGSPDSAEICQAEENGARIQQQLHPLAPQVAEVYDFGIDEGYFYIAMEYIEGADLARVLADGNLDEGRAVHICQQLCDMLEQAHRFRTEIDGREIDGIVHGDLKPGNLRLQDDDRVRVFDFGISKYLSRSRKSTQSRGHSIPYASPERLERGVIDRHSDLWSLGVILYETVSGRRPFRARNDYELEKAILEGRRKPLSRTACSRDLERIIDRALARDPGQRFLSAAELRSALNNLEPTEQTSSEVFSSGDDRTRRTTDSSQASTAPADDHTRRTTHSSLDSDTSTTADENRTRRTATSGRSPGTADEDLSQEADDAGQNRHEVSANTAAAATAASTPPGRPDPSPPPAPVASATPSVAGFKTATHQILRRIQQVGPRRLMLRALVTSVAILVASQLLVLAWASDLRQELVHSEPSEVPALWERYESAARFSLLGLSLWPARGPMREALIAAANRVIFGYEFDQPRLDLSWRDAAHYLQSALNIGADAGELRGKIAYCQAHVDRIEAKALQKAGKTEDALEKRNDAIIKYREAADFDPDWAAPYLGQARIYAYDDFDFERLEQALEDAKQRGYTLGKREIAQLADGHHQECRKLRRQASKQVDQKRSLNQALDHCRESIRLYSDIIGFASAKENLTWAQESLARVERDLERL